MKKLLWRTSLFSLLLLCLNSCGDQQDTLLTDVGKPTFSIDTAISEYPILKLTNGPKQHWFGYYDKLQMDPSGTYVLAAEVDTFYRSPKTTDTLIIGMINIRTKAWTTLGTSTAWGWQQACMLQWIPGSEEEVIWNDFENGKFVSRIYNIRKKTSRTLPKAIYTLSNDGAFALGTDFSRIQNMRPGYGYAGKADPYEAVKAPSEIGIYKMELSTGNTELLLSIAEIAKFGDLEEDLSHYWHYFNHILISPNDQRFVFLHRWRKELADRSRRASGGFITRMITANLDGSDPYVLDPSGYTSHFIWKNDREVCMWTKPKDKPAGFYLFEDRSKRVEAIGASWMKVNGHNTYLPNTRGDWILNDTYPQGKERMQELYLYQVSTNKKISLGKFHEPARFKGEWRSDLHPKASRDGKYVIFDSTHEGDGRQIYLLDISNIAGIYQSD